MDPMNSSINPVVLWPALQYYYEQTLCILIDRLTGPILDVFNDQYRLAECEYENSKRASQTSRRSAPPPPAETEFTVLQIFERYLSKKPWTTDELETIFRSRFEGLGSVVSELTFVGHHLMSILKIVPRPGEELSPEPRSDLKQFLQALMLDLSAAFRIRSCWFSANVDPETRCTNYERCVKVIAQSIRSRVPAAGTTTFLACHWSWKQETLHALSSISQYDASSNTTMAVAHALSAVAERCNNTQRSTNNNTDSSVMINTPSIVTPTPVQAPIVLQDKLLQKYAAEQSQRLNSLVQCAGQFSDQVQQLQSTLKEIGKAIQLQYTIGTTEHAQNRQMLEIIAKQQEEQLQCLRDIFQSNDECTEQVKELLNQQEDMNKEQVTQLANALSGVSASIQVQQEILTECSKTASSATAAAVAASSAANSASTAANSASATASQVSALVSRQQQQQQQISPPNERRFTTPPPPLPAGASNNTACRTPPNGGIAVSNTRPPPTIRVTPSPVQQQQRSAAPVTEVKQTLNKQRPPAIIRPAPTQAPAAVNRNARASHLSYPAAPPSSRRTSVPAILEEHVAGQYEPPEPHHLQEDLFLKFPAHEIPMPDDSAEPPHTPPVCVEGSGEVDRIANDLHGGNPFDDTHPVVVSTYESEQSEVTEEKHDENDNHNDE